MRLTVRWISGIVACWLTVVLIAVIAQVQTAAQGKEKETKIQGLITARNGANMTVKTATGDVMVTLTDATKVDEKEKKLLHLHKKEMAVVGLVPGLKVDVEGMETPAKGQTVGTSGKSLTAKSVTFSGKDLSEAQAIQAGLTSTQQQALANKGAIKTNEQNIAGNAAGVAGNAAGVAVDAAASTINAADIDDLARRFGNLGDYDVKREATVLFDPGKADVSASGKAALDAISQQAKALNGYLIEVEGFADSAGSPAINQTLSLERSQNVIDYLTQSGGISSLHLLAPTAMGANQPAASNETASGRAENRRVVVKVLVNKGLSGQ